MQFITFTDSTDSTGQKNENAFNDLHSRIMTLKGLPTADGKTTDWAKPIAHQTNDWCAMPIDETCYPVMTQAEISSLQTWDQLNAAGWFPSSPAAAKQPWWGFLIWWR